VKLRTTYEQPGAARYRRPGGAWDVPLLDELLSPALPTSRPAVVDGSVRLDAGGFDRLIAGAAGGLRARGVGRGSVVTWQLPNWWEAVVLYRACWRSGAVAAPIHHQVGSAEVARMVGDLEPVVAFGTPGLPLADLADVVTVRGEGDGFGELVHGSRPVEEGVARGSDVAVVLFTSGSTGRPKGVLHTQRGLAYKARSMVRAHGLDSGDVALMPSPLAHVSGLLNSVLVPGTAGMNVVLMERWDPERGVKLAGEHGVSFMIGPPTLFLGMMEVPDYESSVERLRIVSCGSTGVTPEFVDTARTGLGALVKRTYGSTEAPTVTTSAWEDPPERARDTDGHSVGEAEVKIVDASGRRVRPGRRGEVLVRGPELFVGYAEESDTRAAVRRGWFATGDLGTLDDEGWLTIVGRLKEMIIRGGENIASAEVERLLEQHPDVRQAVVVGCPDRRLGERVAAFVVGRQEVDVEECGRWFASLGVARFKTPEVVVHVDELPLLGVGKPDRSLLRRRAAELAGA
jgi:acyl-CoA synthetase (AMP-forming)/AMP-acid ligase II